MLAAKSERKEERALIRADRQMRTWKDLARELENNLVCFEDENDVSKLMSVRYEPTTLAKAPTGAKDWRKIKHQVLGRWQRKEGKVILRNFAFTGEVFDEASFKVELSKCLKKGMAFIDGFLLQGP